MFKFLEWIFLPFEHVLQWVFEVFFRFAAYLGENYHIYFQKPSLTERKIEKLSEQLASGFSETLLMALIPVGLTALIGIPLGVFLAAFDAKGKHYILSYRSSKILKISHQFLNLIVNLGRAVPAIVMIVLFMGLSRFVFGTAIGLKGMILPLTIAAIPFGARVVETAIRSVEPSIIEAAKSMGSSPFQIIYKFLLVEAKPAIISGLTLTYVALVGYSAIAGVVGGGGWGAFAVTVGHGRGEKLGLFLATFLLTMIVIIGQWIGDKLATKADKRKI